MTSLNKDDSRNRTLEMRVQTELQTLYSEPLFDFPIQEVQTQKINSFSIAPIGLFGYAFCCYLAGCVKLGIVQDDTTSKSIGFFLGGLAQYINGIFSWYQGESLNTFLSINYTFFNMSFLVSNIFGAQGVAPQPGIKVYGYINILWCIATIAVSAASYNGPKISFVNNILVFLSFFVQILEAFIGVNAFTKIAGVFLLMVATCIFYITTAILVNGNYKRTILPLFVPGEKLECTITLRIKKEEEA